jgi:peroxiredoxin Q/BCP
MNQETPSKFPLEEFIVDENNNTVLLKDAVELPAIIFFYPKDMTPGCTIESCVFRDNYEEIKKLGFNIYGISADSQKSHANFKKRFNLNYPLLTDVDKKLQEKLGVVSTKKIFGKTVKGTIRSTFIVDINGNIIAKWGDIPNSLGGVNVATHAQDVIGYIKNNYKN